jgi:hypothetical protein
MKSDTVKDKEHTYTFIWMLLFDEVLKNGDGPKISDYVETNAEPLCVEIRHFVRHAFVNHLTC